MGDWEIAIQSPEGGAGEPVGVYGLRPRIFNTGQVMIGWLALYEETGNTKYIDATIKAADWIVSNQDDDGKWTKSTYSGPKAYHSRVAWVLLELFSITKNDTYRVSVERSLNWIMAQATHNAWFNNNSLSEPGKPWTHLIGYVLVGLLEIYRMNRNNSQFEPLIHLLSVAAKNIANIYIQIKNSNTQLKTLPGTLNSNWNSTDKWSCNTGNAQIEFFLRRMFGYHKDSLFITAADMLLEDLKSCHLINGITDPNAYGGLPGSYPINGPYQHYAIPNWGVKFFADSLLQRILPENKQKYLG
jgi:rhamnogalacturonyl hydrolase YesR